VTTQVFHYIGGTFIAGNDFLERRNPSDTDDVVALVPQGGAAEIAQAVTAARCAYPAWSGLTIEQRSDCLDRAGQALFARREEIGALLAREEGKLLAEAIGEVTRASRIFRYFAGEALRCHGHALESVRPGVDVEIHREAVGVFGLITPWNFPIAIPAWKSAPALAFGNTVVLKPSSLSPLVGATLAEILDSAGVTPGAFNLVFGEAEAGAALVAHPDVAGISFTGSQQVGSGIAAAAVMRQARIQLEMGGKNPLVVLNDADLEQAVDIALDGAFFSCGQRCTASSRLIIEEQIHDRFVDRLINRLQELRVGDARDPSSQIGPQVSSEQIRKSLLAIEAARAAGARLITGGSQPVTATPGHYLNPTLFVETTPDMNLNQTEVFGPVASVIRVRDLDEALAVANATPFGLSAGIASTSLQSIRRFRREIRAGMVMANLPTAGVDYHVPFGGTKASSYGPREQGSAAQEFYTQLKTTYLRA
jgi:alpha-ketoglutaric semialdehyde dehydrogenase